MSTYMAPEYDMYPSQDYAAPPASTECLHSLNATPEEGQQEPPVKRAPRVRNSYENGLNWAYINTAFQELVTIMRDRPVQLPVDFRLPSISLYHTHDVYLRDGLLAVVSFLSK